MEFQNAEADVFVPDGAGLDDALGRTTHIAVGAHQDDLEIMAIAPILDCYHSADLAFTGVCATLGRRSPRSGHYADFDNDEMSALRRVEQRTAAEVGRYGAMLQLGYTSSDLQAAKLAGLVDDLEAILRSARPSHIYTHNLADKHATHVATAAATVQAVRRVSGDVPLETFVGCEVWRGLDWLGDDVRVLLDSTGYDALATSLIGLFDSQVSGGKRYDLAALGRRRANATYFQPRETDDAEQITLAMDLMPLADPDSDAGAYVGGLIDQFRDEVFTTLAPFLANPRSERRDD